MSTTVAIQQAKNLVETLITVEEHNAELSQEIKILRKQLSEADANLNALQGKNNQLETDNRYLTVKWEEEVRKNERLKERIVSFIGTVEQARDDMAPTKSKAEPDKKVTFVEVMEKTSGYVPENKGPFYGVHIEKGETIIYPPQQCQTHDQLSQFYRLAGLVISQDMLMERGGIHLRGLSRKHRERLSLHYKLKLPTNEPPQIATPFVKDTAPHHIGEQREQRSS